jgi:hypothetical protein
MTAARATPFARRSGTRTHASAPATTSVPSVRNERTTTSSIVIARYAGAL